MVGRRTYFEEVCAHFFVDRHLPFLQRGGTLAHPGDENKFHSLRISSPICPMQSEEAVENNGFGTLPDTRHTAVRYPAPFLRVSTGHASDSAGGSEKPLKTVQYGPAKSSTANLPCQSNRTYISSCVHACLRPYNSREDCRAGIFKPGACFECVESDISLPGRDKYISLNQVILIGYVKCHLLFISTQARHIILI